MARQKQQPNFDISEENHNRQFQVHRLLERNEVFKSDSEAIRQRYDISNVEALMRNENFLDDVGEIIAKVNAPGHYEAIVIALVLGKTPKYNGYMFDLPKQALGKQFRVKRALVKNLLLYHLVRERGMTYKQTFEYLMEHDLSENMNYTDISKHLAKVEQQIHDIYS